MKKIVIILFIFLLSIVTAACGGKPSLPDASNTSSKADHSNENTLKEIQKRGVLTIAIDDTFPPMEYHNKKNEIVGFDIDLAREIGKQLNVKVKFIPTSWDGILPGLDAKQYDIIMSSLNVTPEREKKYDFVTYAKLGQVVAVQSGNPLDIKTKDDLVGKVVGVQLGSTSETAAKQIKGIKELKTYNAYTDVFNDMGLGRLQGIVVSEAVGRYYKTAKPESFDIVGETFQRLPVGIAVRKSDKDVSEALQKAVDTVKSNGLYAKVSKKWFGTDISKQ